MSHTPFSFGSMKFTIYFNFVLKYIKFTFVLVFNMFHNYGDIEADKSAEIVYVN